MALIAMRLYDFRCDDCDRVFEELVGPDERPTCPSCQSLRTTRAFPTFAVGRSSGSANARADAAPSGGCWGGGCGSGSCGI